MVILKRIDEADVIVEGGGVVVSSFPVVFFDGEREVYIGNIKIDPTLEYKPFLTTLSHIIGISPNQISIYLVDWKNSIRPSFADDRSKIPITGKVNFCLICRQKNCCFLVVMKKFRKSRNRREKMLNGVEFADNEFYLPSMIPVPENPILLRRNQPMPFYSQITDLGLAELNYRLMVIQRDNYNYQMAMNTSLNSLVMMDNIRRASAASANKIMTKTESNKGLCDECDEVQEWGTTPSFHVCINDAVVTHFTTGFGPISRPIYKQAC